MQTKAQIAGLYRYPVKSARGLAVAAAVVRRSGLPGDREWMIVDETGTFVTQRQKAALAMLAVEEEEGGRGGITLACSGHRVRVERDAVRAAAVSRQVTVWRDTVRAFDCGDEVASFLAATLGPNRGRALRLVLLDEPRNAAPFGDFSGENGTVTFADGYPFLVTNEASLADLQSRVDVPLSMLRFRPNVVLSGLAAYAEDRIESVRTASGVELRFMKPCDRCVITTVDPETAAKGAEPLKTLGTYRKTPDGIMFGENAVLAAGEGQLLRVGDEVEVRLKASPA